MSLAIFDLDNTLIGGDSDYLWGEFLCEIGAVDVEKIISSVGVGVAVLGSAKGAHLVGTKVVTIGIRFAHV